jgi:hypothetical protein
MCMEVDLVWRDFAQVLQNLARAVFRGVVNDDQLFADVAQINRSDALDDLSNGVRLVVCEHQAWIEVEDIAFRAAFPMEINSRG